MKPAFAILPGAVVATLSIVAGLIAADDLPGSGKPESKLKSSQVAPSIAAAQQQAVLLHEAMHSSLRVTHDRFYREDEALPIPASALKEVFADIKKKQGVSLRWLVVEGQAMNSDHKAKSEFEKEAVEALKSGKESYEQFDKGFYRRAGAITLSNHCLKCHVPDRKDLKDRTAGLIITIPIKNR